MFINPQCFHGVLCHHCPCYLRTKYFLPSLQIQDRKSWEQQEAERIQQLIEERELAVQHRERLKRMHVDKEAFLDKLKSERRTVYQVCYNFKTFVLWL